MQNEYENSMNILNKYKSVLNQWYWKNEYFRFLSTMNEHLYYFVYKIQNIIVNLKKKNQYSPRFSTIVHHEYLIGIWRKIII